MKVPYSEGVATHTGPESCAGHREVSGEALTGESIGQPLSRESRSTIGMPTLYWLRKATRTDAYIARSAPIPRGQRPWHVQTLLVREPGGLTRDRGPRRGPHREGEEP